MQKMRFALALTGGLILQWDIRCTRRDAGSAGRDAHPTQAGHLS
jgi:hypothetical protein